MPNNIPVSPEFYINACVSNQNYRNALQISSQATIHEKYVWEPMVSDLNLWSHSQKKHFKLKYIDSFIELRPSANSEYSLNNWADVWKAACAVRSYISFELIGNSKVSKILLGVNSSYVSNIKTLIKANFPTISIKGKGDYLKENVDKSYIVYQYYSIEPIQHPLLPKCETMGNSPFYSLLRAMLKVPCSDYIGIQVLFSPAQNDYFKLARKLADLEFSAKDALKYPQSCHIPSNTISKASKDLDEKLSASNFLCLSIRVFGSRDYVKLIDCYIENYSIAGAGLKKYSSVDIPALHDSMIERRSFIEPMILTNKEFSTLCHIPKMLHNSEYSIELNRSIPVSSEFEDCDGIEIGVNNFDEPCAIRFPLPIQHVLSLGLSGSGKSTFHAGLCLELIRRGFGVAFVCPEESAVNLLLANSSEISLDQIVYLDFTHDEYVPAYQPLQTSKYISSDFFSSDSTEAMRCLFVTEDSKHLNVWGGNIDLFLNLAFHMAHNKTNFIDLLTILSKSKEGSALRSKLLQNFNKELQDYIKYLFLKVSAEHLQPVTKRILKLLEYSRGYDIFSQRISKINFREIITQKKALIINIRSEYLGSTLSNIIGSFIINSLYLEKKGLLPDISPFYLFVDEFPQFSFNVISALALYRKIGLNLILSNQTLSQMQDSFRSILSNAQGLFGFNMSPDDAVHFAKHFMCNPLDLSNQRIGEAYARINGSITNFSTRLIEGKNHIRIKEILNYCIPRYYVRIDKGVDRVLRRDQYDEV